MEHRPAREHGAQINHICRPPQAALSGPAGRA